MNFHQRLYKQGEAVAGLGNSFAEANHVIPRVPNQHSDGCDVENFVGGRNFQRFTRIGKVFVERAKINHDSITMHVVAERAETLVSRARQSKLQAEKLIGETNDAPSSFPYKELGNPKLTFDAYVSLSNSENQDPLLYDKKSVVSCSFVPRYKGLLHAAICIYFAGRADASLRIKHIGKRCLSDKFRPIPPSERTQNYSCMMISDWF